MPSQDLVTSVEPVVDIAAASSCPPPLEWQEILGTFLREAEPWYLDRPGHRVTGRIWGQGKPVYFLPGFGGTLDLYALLVWLLREDHRCVLLDWPGNDDGRVPPGRPRLETLAEDLFAVADLCHDRQFDLFASSFGTLVATQAMLSQPVRVGRAILQSAFAHRQLAFGERLLATLSRGVPWRLRHVPMRKAIQLQNHSRWFPPFDPSRLQFLLENTGGVRLQALGWRAAIVVETDLRPRLAELRQPLLFLQGEGEGQLAETCLREFTDRYNPPPRIERLNNTGPLPHLTHPHRVAKLVREFLSP
jgi:pimeloyl-ACP methyl ester carboxylesterase